jgi:hypothetical protein
VRRLAAVVVVLSSLVACDTGGETGPTSTTTTTTRGTIADAAACSAAGLRGPGGQDGLPVAVAATRKRIIGLALGCDFDGLAAFAMEGDFVYSFGGGDDPSGFWRGQEDEGDRVMEKLVQLLGLSFTERQAGGSAQYIWPAAYASDSWTDVTAVERQELLAVYSDAELAQFEEFGAYAGYRVAITPDGDWSFFVAGD